MSGAAPAWISREAVGPILRRMEKVKERDLTLRSMALLGSCCLCGLPLYFLASLERKNQKRMRELLEELKSTIVASGGAGVRFVSMLRRYQGPDEVYKYEDKWLGFARTEEAVDRLNDLPTNWLPYATSRVFKNINRLEVRDRVY